MAYQSGHGGSVTGPGIAGDVRMWDLTDMVQTHDVSVLSDTARKRIPGIGDWNANLDFLLSATTDMTAASTKPGDSVSLALTALPAGTTEYSGTGIVRDIRMTRDVNREINGRMTVECNGTLTRPDNSS